MKAQNSKTKQVQKRVAIVAVTLTIIIFAVVLGIAASSCTTQSGVSESGFDEAVAAVVDNTSNDLPDMDSQDEPEEVPTTEAEPAETESAETIVGAHAAKTQPTAAQSTSSTPSQSQPTGSTSSQSTPSTKRWVEDTQQVWVEDKAAWTESVPVYGTKEVSICNVCGADVTGNTSAHAKAHMMAGEGSGHHSEVRQTITGYNTVNHPAEGHYETKVVGGHWE